MGGIKEGSRNMKRIAGVVIAAMIIGLLGKFAGAEEMESAPPVVEASAVPSLSLIHIL